MSESLPPKLLGETITVEFNFTDVMLWGETLDSSTVSVSVVSGLDPSPQLLLSGSSEIAGNTVSQTITEGRPGVVYALVATANCSGGTSYQKVRRLAVLSDEGSFQPSSLVRLIGTLPNAVVGQPYSEPLDIIGGYAPYRYDGIESGAAPFWMNFHVEDAQLICAGTPNESVATEYIFSPRIADAANNLANDPQDIFSLPMEIVGDVPDGDIATSISGSYTNVGGTPPVTYSILSGTFPVSGGLNPDGTYSGTLDTAGYFSWIVEGIDSNGVHAQLSDSNTVRAAQFMFVGANSSGTSAFIKSLDSVTWTRTTVTGGNRTIVRYHETIVRCGITSASVSFNNGSSWQGCSGFTGNTISSGVYANGMWVLGTSPGITRSSNGINFTYVNYSQPAFDNMAAAGNMIVSAFTKSAVSFDRGLTWTFSSVFVFDTVRYACTGMDTNGEIFVAVCDGNGVTGQNWIGHTTDGIHWTRDTSPWNDAGNNKCIAYDPITHRWGVFNGRRFAYSDNGTSWTAVGNILPSGFSAESNGLICYNGVWVVSCDSLNDPRVYSSLDNGLTWTQRSDQLANTIFGGAVGLILP